MRISELGEFALIERLQQCIGVQRPDIIVGIGDDVAVLADREDEYLLATVDNHVENVHYLPYLITPQQLGRRALAVNLSDIAAMGGTPHYALVSLALPPDTDVAWLEACYTGMQALAQQSGVAIVGGNITRSVAGVAIDITVLGRVRHDQIVLRSGAQPGDKVLVTGYVGDAFAGLQLVFQPTLAVEPWVRETLILCYLEPLPRLQESVVIAQAGVATAMIDVSDGLGGDLGHICDRSQVGVTVWADALPTSSGMHQVAHAMGVAPWKLALEGGDDYGLCFTVPSNAVEELKHAIAEQTGTLITVIGEIQPKEQGRHVVLPDGQSVPLDASSWQHFGTQS